MKLYHTFFMSTAIILGLATGAAQLTPYENRYNNQEDSYGRLLAGEYQKIAGLESRAGTYDNIEFFKEQSEKAISDYNPRPMTFKGLGNTDSHLQELLQMRTTLDRAMVGYAMRNNPSAVAKMHAAFDCRLKNVNINRKIDNICKQEFNKYAKQAEENANPIPSSPAPVTTPSEPIIRNPMMPEPVVSAPVKFEPVTPHVPASVEAKPAIAPVTPVPVESKSTITPVPTPVEAKPIIAPVTPVPMQSKSTETSVAPVSIGQTDYVPETENFTNSFVPQSVSQPIPQSQKLPTPAEPVIDSTPSKSQSTIPQTQNKVLMTEPAETFDPLEHIHPSLRNKIRQEQQTHPAPTATPVPSTPPVQPNSQTIPEYKPNATSEENPPIPQDPYGTHPLSEVKKPTLGTSSLQSPTQDAKTIPNYKTDIQNTISSVPQEEFGIKPLSEVKKPTLDTSSLQYNRSPMDMIASPSLTTMTR